jgi:hypothetical protein
VATLPGTKLLQTSTPFWLKELITGCAAAEFMPGSKAGTIRNKGSLVLINESFEISG